MSKQNFTHHIYIYKSAIHSIMNDGNLDDGDIVVLSTADASNDYKFYLCSVDLAVKVPTLEQMALMEKAGVEKELKAFRESSLSRIMRMQERIEELTAITYQPEY